MKRLKLTTVCCVIVPLVCCAITGFTLFFAIYESLDLWEDIANAVERTYEICGYQADKKAESIMYQTNACDSVVMFEDHRSASAIEEQMRTQLKQDDRWAEVQIPEEEAYQVILDKFSGSSAARIHYRPVCNIDGGAYDYMFREIELRQSGNREVISSIYGCLIDVETGAVALYIHYR